MFPQIPENVLELSSTELRQLARSIKDAARAALSGTLTAEQRTEVTDFLTKRDEFIALAASKDADAATLAALSADDSDADPEVKVEVDVPVAPAAPAPAPEPAPAEPTEDDVDPALGGKVVTTFGQRSTPTGPTVSKRLAAEYLTAAEDVEGKRAGDTFASWKELSDAAITIGNSLSSTSERKYTLAKVKGNYDAAHTLSDTDLMLNASKFDPDEITAAFCAPATPHYDISCMSTLRRPVFNSLPGFQAPRMQVSIMPSPTLADIVAGYGIWDTDDDADPTARKNCATITCGSPTVYQMYGIWRCLTVKNLLWMSYPELVEAWLNKLGAAHARLAEQTLLEAMAAGVTNNIDAPALGYGATVSITSTILNYLALYQETQRWDITENMEAWIPRWVLHGIQMDIARRRQTNGGAPEIPSVAQIEAMFRNVGVNPHWFIDTPSWAVAIPAVGTANLNLPPQSVQILIAPPGKFALMDRGELSIGVTGNNIYRDNASNAQNQFTFFFENFEGIVNTNTCPAHILDIPVCWNGVQIADVRINCQGGDEVGQDS